MVDRRWCLRSPIVAMLCVSSFARCAAPDKSIQLLRPSARSSQPAKLDVPQPSNSPSSFTKPEPAGCPQLNPTALARARALTLDRKSRRTQGQLLLDVSVDPDKDPAHWFAPLIPLRLDAMSTAELDAAESDAPKPSSEDARHLRLQTVGADGTIRQGSMSLDHLESGSRLTGPGQVLLRIDTEAIRLALGSRVLYEERRPASEPIIEARLLDRHPLRIAVRARGITTPLHLTLHEPQSGVIHSLDQINPARDGEQSCWTLISDVPELQGSANAPFLLVLIDLFHRWTFSAPHD
jgi:hypothetical protein